MASNGGAIGGDSKLVGWMAWVDAGLQRLSLQEEQVLRLLFGIGEPSYSREDLGRRLGMSRSWLRQIERRALRNLRCVALAEEVAEEEASLDGSSPTMAYSGIGSPSR